MLFMWLLVLEDKKRGRERERMVKLVEYDTMGRVSPSPIQWHRVVARLRLFSVWMQRQTGAKTPLFRLQ